MFHETISIIENEIPYVFESVVEQHGLLTELTTILASTRNLGKSRVHMRLASIFLCTAYKAYIVSGTSIDNFSILCAECLLSAMDTIQMSYTVQG